MSNDTGRGPLSRQRNSRSRRERIKAAQAEASAWLQQDRERSRVKTDNRLASLLRADLTDIHEWPDSRLGVWCRDLPLLLLAALTIAGEPSQEGLPRDKGPYKKSDMHGVLHYAVLAEIESDPKAWRTLGRWACERLYREWRRRKGFAHACEARVYWCGRTHGSTADAVLGYRD